MASCILLFCISHCFSCSQSQVMECVVCVHTSQRKGFSPECCSECTFRDMLRLKDFPQVSQVNGMSFVWARDRQKTYCIRHKYVSLVYCVAISTFEKISWWCSRFKYSLGQCWTVSVRLFTIRTDHVLTDMGHRVEFLLTNLTGKFLLCKSMDNLNMLVEGPQLLKGLITWHTLGHKKTHCYTVQE